MCEMRKEKREVNKKMKKMLKRGDNEHAKILEMLKVMMHWLVKKKTLLC